MDRVDLESTHRSGEYGSGPLSRVYSRPRRLGAHRARHGGDSNRVGEGRTVSSTLIRINHRCGFALSNHQTSQSSYRWYGCLDSNQNTRISDQFLFAVSASYIRGTLVRRSTVKLQPYNTARICYLYYNYNAFIAVSVPKFFLCAL